MPSLRSASAAVVHIGRRVVVRFGRLSPVQVGRHSVVQFKPSTDTYNWCDAHAALRLRQVGCARKWRERTPAMAAGLTERVWTLGEVLGYRVPPVPLTAPQAPRRGPPSSKGKVLPLAGRSPVRSGPPGRQAA